MNKQLKPVPFRTENIVVCHKPLPKCKREWSWCACCSSWKGQMEIFSECLDSHIRQGCTSEDENCVETILYYSRIMLTFSCMALTSTNAVHFSSKLFVNLIKFA